MNKNNINKTNLGFWANLPKPFSVLAPMEDVTDTVFRQVVASCGRPDVFFTEFTSSEGIASVGREKVAKRLEFNKTEKPLVAQIWGKSPEAYAIATKLIVDMGFDGVDINMGCPVAKIVKQGCCSALIDNPVLALEIIDSVKESAGDLPVSVKTRIGFKERKTEEWTTLLLEQNLAALTIHGRTTKEMSKAPADWNEIGKVVKLKNKISPETVIIGNGDIKTLSEAKEMYDKYNVDGVMIGRGVFENPWVFNENIIKEEITVQQKIDLLKYHLALFEETWGERKNYEILKKFFKIYINGFDGASQLRQELMETREYNEAFQIINGIIID